MRTWIIWNLTWDWLNLGRVCDQLILVLSRQEADFLLHLGKRNERLRQNLLNLADIIRFQNLLLECLGKVAQVEKEAFHIAEDFLLKLVLATKIAQLEDIFRRLEDLPG